jgi:hypothetical protein
MEVDNDGDCHGLRKALKEVLEEQREKSRAIQAVRLPTMVAVG